MFRRVLMMSVVVLTFAACERNKGIAAKVNGVPISTAELGTRLASGAGMGKAGELATPAQRQAALDELILEELQAQKAKELGYQADETGSAARSGPRHSLASQFRMKELLEKAVVTPEEARAWFDAHAARVQADYRIQQLKVQGRPAGEAVLAALAAGKSFDEAAAAQYPQAPEPKPWAEGTLGWVQVPPPWFPALDSLEAGQTTGLIADQGDRYWIVKLIEKKPNTAFAFEQAAPAIQATLQAAKFEERRVASEKELRTKARVEILP